MGNCHKGRLCQFFHDHCQFLFFGHYQSIFDRNGSSDASNTVGETTNINQQLNQHRPNGTIDSGQHHHHHHSHHQQQHQQQHHYYHVTSPSHQYRGDGYQSVCQSPSSSNRTTTTLSSKNHWRSKKDNMNRQRSASHCPHHTGQYDGKSVSPSGHKCCCAKAKHTSGGIALGHGDTPFGAGNNLDPNVAGRSKRASSLRILNKRFNFHFTNQHNENQQTKNGERRSSNVSSETNSGMRQPTSATYHHGSSANHQIIYHSNNILNRNSKKQKHHHVKLNELDDRSLKHIFEYLTLKERLQYERVCRRWQALIRTSFLAPASLKIGEHSVKCNCQCSYFPSWDLPPGKRFKRDEAGYIIYPNSVLKYLLPLCRNLKCLNFSHCYLDDQALQIIIAHSDTIECLHLNDIRLEEGNDDLETLADFSSPSTNTTVNDLNISSTNRTANSSDELMSNDHHPSEENTITSAVSQFATEQLAVFGGFVRKLSTRKPAKKATHGNGGAGVSDQVINNVNIGRSKQPAEHLAHSAHQTPQQPNKTSHQRHQRSGSAVTRRNMVAEQPENSNAMRGTRTNMPTNVANNGKMGNGSSKLARKSVDPINVGLHYKLSNNLSYPNINTTTINTNTAGHTSTGINHMEYMNYSNQPTDVSVSKSSIVDSSVDHRNSSSPNNGPSSGKTSTSNIASAATAAALSNAIGQRRAQHRRREWSRHRSSNNNQNTLQMQLQLQQDKLQQQHIQPYQLDDSTKLSTTAINVEMQPSSTYIRNNSLGNDSNSSSAAGKRLLVNAAIAPNISSLQTDSDVRITSNSNSNSSSGASNLTDTSSMHVERQHHSPLNRTRHHQQQQQQQQQQQPRQSHHHHQRHSAAGVANNSIDTALAISRMDDIQAFVEQEQRRRECRQSHLMHWKQFSKKLGAQIRCLSVGGLTAVDQVVIDLLLKHCVALDELRINNEIDILSYLTIIKHTVKRIYINCEHGIGLECVSLLAFRNYAEKVINLGRVDVPPDLIDSVISAIGSNFSNLRSLHMRLHNFDIDVSTPANLLFNNLYELNLQFVSGNVDLPFKKLIQLGWQSVQSLTIQYASITEESVRAIGESLPQLRKLVLHAVEFRCDHPSKRYGHRICTNCSHSVWKCIASLPYLTQLKLHRVIIDAEICKALSRMTRLNSLDLQYCSNVSDNVVSVCTDLARRQPRRLFNLNVISRGFVTYKPPVDCPNLLIDIKVAAR